MAYAPVPLLQALRIALGVVVLATLPALAYASPPDPAWIQGIYDDADGDDIVALALSGTGHVPPAGLAHLQPIPPLIGTLPDAIEDAPAPRSASAVQPRAPPAS